MIARNVPQTQGKFGTRHVQALLMAVSLIISHAMCTSISVAIVAMTDSRSTNPDFKEYSWGANEKSTILTSFMWGYVVMQVPSGYLANTWSAHKVFSIGFFLSGVVNLLTPILADYGGWIAVCGSRIAMGVCQACYLPCLHTLVSKWAPPYERSRISTFISSGVTLGTVLAMGLSGVIAASNIGWPGIFYVFGILNIITCVVFYLRVTDSPAVHPTISQEEKDYIIESLNEVENHEDEKPQPPWKDIFTSMPMWAIIVAHFGVNWGAWTLSTEIPTYMKSVLKFEIAQNGLISSLPYVVEWLLSFPSSWLADYAIRKDVSTTVVRKVCNTVGSWLPAIFLVILCFVDSLDTIWPVMMLILAGGTKASVACGFNVNHIDLSPNFAGSMYSISNTMGTVAGIIAPMLCGLIVQDSVDPDKWHIVFYITAFVFFASNLFFIIFGSGAVQSWNDPKRKVSITSASDPKTIATKRTA